MPKCSFSSLLPFEALYSSIGMALPALAILLLWPEKVRVLRTELVSPIAVSHSLGDLRESSASTAPVVTHLACHKMLRIDASAMRTGITKVAVGQIVALVINRVPVRDRALFYLVGEAVRHDVLPTRSDAAVSGDRRADRRHDAAPANDCGIHESPVGNIARMRDHLIRRISASVDECLRRLPAVSTNGSTGILGIATGRASVSHV